jgi:hypothetical protein
LLSGNEIPPGGEGKIGVTVRSGDRRRQLRQIVNVQTNDPINASIKLSVSANVVVELEIVPNLLRFDQNQSNVASVKIKNHSDRPVQLSDIDSSNEYVNISVSSMTIPSKGEAVVTGKLLPNVPEGILSGWLKMKTDLKSFPMIQVRIWGNSP